MLRSCKVACGLAAVAVSSMLVFPCAAFGANYVSVNGEGYASAASGEGWSWDGANTLTLDNYTGGPIAAEGDLVINLVGESIVVKSATDLAEAAVSAIRSDLNADGVSAESGTLVITSESEGTLDIKGEYVAVYAADGLTVKNADLLVYAEGLGLNTDGVLEVDGGTVGVMVTSEDPEASLIGMSGYGMSITNSFVEVVAKSTYKGAGIESVYTAGIDVYGKDSSINVANSSLKVSAISSRGGDTVTGIANLASRGGIYADGTELTVYVSGPDDIAEGVGVYASSGDLGIYNSTVSVSATGGAARGLAAQVIDYSDAKAGPEMTLANSSVSVESSGAAVSSLYYGYASEEASLAKKGVIVLENSKITLGGQIQDVEFAYAEGSGNVWAAGQAIGSGDSASDPDSVTLASKVVIEPGEDDEAVEPDDGAADDIVGGAGSNAGAGAGSDPSIAPTGDDAPAAGIAAAFAAIAAAVVGAVAAVRRRLATN